ncbi:MAG: VOC family protein [Halobacteriovoraceae bacterium]|nr:VOC family protein [Halobacteriovoraceae bacterium]
MIKAVGKVSNEHKNLVKEVFLKNDYNIDFAEVENLNLEKELVISFDKEATRSLSDKGIKFFNWDLLFSVLGPNDNKGDIEKKLDERIRILKAVKSLKSRPFGEELHGSIRVNDLAESSSFYTWLFGVEPKEWTHRYVTFQRPDTKFNFVLLVADGKELNHDTLYHLGMGVSSKEMVVNFYHSAVENGFPIEKPPRTTWRGTPLHELWLKDPDGTLIEIYSRLSEEELAEMPADKEPVDLLD